MGPAQGCGEQGQARRHIRGGRHRLRRRVRTLHVRPGSLRRRGPVRPPGSELLCTDPRCGPHSPRGQRCPSHYLRTPRQHARASAVQGSQLTMRTNYDFSKAKRSPYAKQLKRSITIRIDRETIEYFKRLAAKTELPYQSLINLYLRDCAAHHRELAMEWRRSRKGAA